MAVDGHGQIGLRFTVKLEGVHGIFSRRVSEYLECEVYIQPGELDLEADDDGDSFDDEDFDGVVSYEDFPEWNDE